MKLSLFLDMNKQLFNQSLHYQTLGLNIFCISNSKNIFNYSDGNLLKAPNHDWERFKEEKQSSQFLESLDTQNITGIGVILGYNNICALDIDGCTDISFIYSICKVLNLPNDYQWIFKSGSQLGYHILFQCDNIVCVNFDEKKLANLSESENAFGNGDTNAYYPIFSKRIFHKIEFKWQGHLVLPSSLHITGLNYEFTNKLPLSSPLSVKYESLLSLKILYTSLQAKTSILGENTITIQRNAKKDETMFNYEIFRVRPYIIFTVHKYKITGIDSLTANKLCLVQLNWYVLDKNLNVERRRTFNFYKQDIDFKYDSVIDYEKAKQIVVDCRYALMEFLFDVDHSEKIVTCNSLSLKVVQAEILQSGLYLDNFKKRKFSIEETNQDFDKLPNKEVVYYEVDSNNYTHTIHLIYIKLLKSNRIRAEYSYPTDENINDSLSKAEKLITWAKMTPEEQIKEKEKQEKENNEDEDGYNALWEDMSDYDAFEGDEWARLSRE